MRWKEDFLRTIKTSLKFAALHDGGYQITVRDKSGTYLWDAVCGWYTYGFPHLLEVCGLALVDHYDVEGWLTARQVMKMWGRRNAAKNR